MRLRRAKTLIGFFRNSREHYLNFLTKQAFLCGWEGRRVLCLVEEWTEVEEIFPALSEYTPLSISNLLGALVRAGGLVIEGSISAVVDEQYHTTWHWDIIAGAYHFSIKNSDYANEEFVLAELRSRAETSPSPPLFLANGQNAVRLPEPSLQGLLDLMRRRRTIRAFGDTALKLECLSECLVSGLRVVAFVEGPTPGMLPLTMTPSGGARNPYEAYVYVLNVEGLEPGIHHYSATEHNLRFDSIVRIPPASMLGHQAWANSASAIIFLIANMDRTMWKYRHPNAYRIVLIEAGHIAQNITLTATNLGLASATTCALDDEIVESALGLVSLTQAAIYAIVIGTV